MPARGSATSEQCDSSNSVLMEKQHQNMIGLNCQRMELLICVISWAPSGQSAAFLLLWEKTGLPAGNACLHECLCLHKCTHLCVCTRMLLCTRSCLHKHAPLHERIFTCVSLHKDAFAQMRLCTRMRVCSEPPCMQWVCP